MLRYFIRIELVSLSDCCIFAVTAENSADGVVRKVIIGITRQLRHYGIRCYRIASEESVSCAERIEVRQV